MSFGGFDLPPPSFEQVLGRRLTTLMPPEPAYSAAVSGALTRLPPQAAPATTPPPIPERGTSMGLFESVLSGATKAAGEYYTYSISKKRLKTERALAKARAGYRPDPYTYYGPTLPQQVPPDWIPVPGDDIGNGNAFQGGEMMQASYLQASAPAAALAIGGAIVRIAPRVAARFAQRLRQLLPSLTAGGASSMATWLLANGISADEGPYANPKHNKVTGVMRGDVIALRRVKRQARRLQKVIRMAGVGRRTYSGRRARRRAC